MNELDELKNAVPETPESFHRMVEQTVKTELGEAGKIIPISAKKGRRALPAKFPQRRHLARLIATIAAIVILVPGLVYAAVRYYRMHLEEKGEYAIQLSITEEGTSSEEASEVSPLPETLPGVTLQVDPVPEGFRWTNPRHLMDDTDPYRTGFFFTCAFLDTESFEQSLTEYYVTNKEELTLGEHAAVYVDHQSFRSPAFTQYLFVAYPEYQRIVIIYATNNIPKEDFLSMAGNMVLVPSGEEKDTDNLLTWSMYLKQINGFTDRAINSRPVKTDDEPINFTRHQVGETVQADYPKGVDITLDNIQIEDDISLLDPVYLLDRRGDNKFSGLVDEAGNLLPATVNFVRYGDGVNFLDTVVDTVEVPRKLLYSTITYTNTTDEAIEHMIFFPYFQIVGYWGHERLTTSDYDTYFETPYINRDHDSMIYYDIDDITTDGGNHIPYLGPGESKTIHVAWIVTEDELPYIYLRFGQEQYSKMFDIRQ